jgi:pilus assembly protein CpaE
MAKVLFIDDEPIYYRMILPTFKEQGLELRYSKNGMEGLAEVPLFMPDVIVTDVRLPDISGYEIAERMRRDPRFSRIPIIFVTGQSDLKDKLKAFELGADDYLVKPFQPEELVARLGILIRRTEALKAVSRLEVDYKQTSTIVAVHSLRGGVGCSSMAVNLAISFQQLWLKPTLLMDGVLVAGQVALMLNSSPRVTWADYAGLQAEHIDDEVVTKLVQHHQSGVQFIASPSTPAAPDEFPDEFWPAIIDKLNEYNDFIVVDTSHDFNNMTIHMLDAASHIILVISPEMASLRSAVCALDIYERLGFGPERIFVLVNQVFDQNAIKQSQIEKVIRRPVDMMIPYVPNEFLRGINFGEPFVFKNPDSPITGLFEDAAFWLSNDIHKNIPPVAPTAAWRRVNSRLQIRKV